MIIFEEFMHQGVFTLPETYWEDFQLTEQDIEFLYNHLLEAEIPQPTNELLTALVSERIRQEKSAADERRTAGGEVYQPKGTYGLKENLVFPALDWKHGQVMSVRAGENRDIGQFQVIQVAFDDGSLKEFASGLEAHKLNQPLKIDSTDTALILNRALDRFGDSLSDLLEEYLGTNPDFVKIAGNWFPLALLVDINAGYLNLAEAVLDMAGGGPISTSALIEQTGLPADVNPRLLEFSMNLALQEDARFDEVGPAGKVLWFLQKQEPQEVLEPPLYLRYSGMDYDRSKLGDDMLDLERDLDDELSPLEGRYPRLEEVELRLIYPHWRAGTMPLSGRVRHLFPTAYEAPRIRFTLVDGQTGESFPAWVVREKRYIYGLKRWYQSRGLTPGSLIRVRRGINPGEVILKADTRRASREWIRTVLVGSDGGVVFAMLKHNTVASYDERLAIIVPDTEALDAIWTRNPRDLTTLDKVVVSLMRELSKLNPQGHVHASELYAAVNVIRRCPPAPILEVLASKSNFVHVGDLHFRFIDQDET